MKNDNFRNRYIIRLSSSIIIAALNIVVQLLLPRALSVEEYGYYSYNLNVFTSLVGISNLSANSAMISKFAKRNEEIGLVRFYMKFWFLMLLILNAVMALLYPLKVMKDTFGGQTLLIVMLGLEYAILTKLLGDVVSMYDSMAISRFPASVQIVSKVLLDLSLLAAYFLGRLNLAFFYAIQLIILAITIIILLRALFSEQKSRYPEPIDRGRKEYLKEYYEYCRPLVFSNIISQFVVIFMNWALMWWAGATEQALFGVAWQLNSFVGYVFTSYAELSKREFAVISDDKQALGIRYVQALKLMMWATAYFAIFTGFMAPWILPLVYSEKYTGAAMVTLLIMFYTVYQAWGQISGSFLLATENTKVSARLNIINIIINMGFAFLFQIPNCIWPNGLGGIGIALTYLCTNICGMWIMIYVISRMLNISFWWCQAIQVVPIVLCSALSIILYYVMNKIFIQSTIGIFVLKILISGCIYTMVIAIVIWSRPELAGLSRESIKDFLKRLGRGIKRSSD